MSKLYFSLQQKMLFPTATQKDESIVVCGSKYELTFQQYFFIIALGDVFFAPLTRHCRKKIMRLLLSKSSFR
jgi:hypothetical protein